MVYELITFKKNFNGNMKIYYNLNISSRHKNSVIAIGNFDGIHKGHQKVLKQAKKKAKKNKTAIGIVTFEPMPVMFFNKKLKNHRINSLDQKISQLKSLKIDFLIILKFNKSFSSFSAEKFIKNIIYDKLRSKYVFVSNNFKFGKNRKGNTQTLKRFENIFAAAGHPNCIFKINFIDLQKITNGSTEEISE